MCVSVCWGMGVLLLVRSLLGKEGEEIQERLKKRAGLQEKGAFVEGKVKVESKSSIMEV